MRARNGGGVSRVGLQFTFGIGPGIRTQPDAGNRRSRTHKVVHFRCGQQEPARAATGCGCSDPQYCDTNNTNDFRSTGLVR